MAAAPTPTSGVPPDQGVTAPNSENPGVPPTVRLARQLRNESSALFSLRKTSECPVPSAAFGQFPPFR